jgi:hypothetical protein
VTIVDGSTSAPRGQAVRNLLRARRRTGEPGCSETAPLTIARARRTVNEASPVSADTHISLGIPRTNSGQLPFIYIEANDALGPVGQD